MKASNRSGAHNDLNLPKQPVQLKQIGSWFAAGDGFGRALETLSDGAFRLFAWLCLRAERPSGQILATRKELAAALGKSKRALSTYVRELEAKGVCRVEPGPNQYARTRFEINDGFWPYERSAASMSGTNSAKGLKLLSESVNIDGVSAREITAREIPAVTSYVAAVREMFLRLGCGKGSFGPADEKTALKLESGGVPLSVVDDALLLGEARKYLSWLNHGESGPIGSLEYFRPVIEELMERPLPTGYNEHLRAKTREFRRRWKSIQAAKSDLSTLHFGGAKK
ncbi:MAG TPA: helix-turn-helix domain-containing protein [Blastocatellia bacterium]|nr:helix-turn-helix domain-containing protein [Blastocatellia bacterium]